MSENMTDWHNLYGEGWTGIVPESFSHPAKFSRALIRHIYEHAIAQGYLREGDIVLDPFAGVALGAADALAFGLDWIGNELERPFVDMGAGCECTGISKMDWARCFGRWDRFRYSDGRHWCPRCLAQAGQVTHEPKKHKLTQTQAKRRKQMRELMERTGRSVDFSLYDPMPFPDSKYRPARAKTRNFLGDLPTASYERDSGKIPHTDPHHYTGNLELFTRYARNGARAVLLQGDSRNLVEVLDGARAKGLVASPPYADSIDHAPGNRNWDHSKGTPGNIRQSAYSSSPANLGNMREGDHEATVKAVVSSPPMGQAQTGGTGFWEGLEEKHGRRFSERVREGSQGYRKSQLGDDPANLGNMREGDHEAVVGGVVSSPPYSPHGVGHDAGHPRLDDVEDERRAREGCNRRQAYGITLGQLAAMPEGLVSSPPYEGSMDSGDENRGARADRTGGFKQGMSTFRYGQNPFTFLSKDPSGLNNQQRHELAAQNQQVGALQGDTFWSAARMIVEQCWQVLAPGAVAIFVTKRFVRNGQIVEFSQQWKELCEAVGFECVEWIKAWLVEDRGTQYMLNGEAEKREARRMSFFRRLHAKKYPHLSIDWEDVLIFRKVDLG